MPLTGTKGLWLKSLRDCGSQGWCPAGSSRNAQVLLSYMHKDFDKQEINMQPGSETLSEKPAWGLGPFAIPGRQVSL